jgi:hypothetical protein
MKIVTRFAVQCRCQSKMVEAPQPRPGLYGLQVAISPLLLWPALGWATPPAAALIAFLLLGTENIGAQIEEPMHVLALDAICRWISSRIHSCRWTFPTQSTHITSVGCRWNGCAGQEWYCTQQLHDNFVTSRTVLLCSMHTSTRSAQCVVQVHHVTLLSLACAVPLSPTSGT